MKRRGKIRKRTIVLEGTGLSKGSTVEAAGKRLGVISSTTNQFALAILRIDHLAQALAEDAKIESKAIPVTAMTPDWLISEMKALQNVST